MLGYVAAGCKGWAAQGRGWAGLRGCWLDYRLQGWAALHGARAGLGCVSAGWTALYRAGLGWAAREGTWLHGMSRCCWWWGCVAAGWTAEEQGLSCCTGAGQAGAAGGGAAWLLAGLRRSRGSAAALALGSRCCWWWGCVAAGGTAEEQGAQLLHWRWAGVGLNSAGQSGGGRGVGKKKKYCTECQWGPHGFSSMCVELWCQGRDANYLGCARFRIQL
ncbi:hypothetical protein Acr_00g0029300 [Actinidia rufa]|uniref:Uncharacterized protein n=1 Tax=Actinidia rufa TaxID=165716 RepID=A0A7J0DEQ8_9ERIC|nr:hypothetical protein Acr_00g0029300 [Actinidia rufa]